MHFIVEKFVSKPEKKTELEHLLTDFQKETLQNDPGCESYVVMDMYNNTFVTKVLFQSEADFVSHQNTIHCTKFNNVCSDLLDSRMRRVHQIRPVLDLEQSQADEVYHVDSDTLIDEIKAIPENVKGIRILGEVNHNQMLAMPDHINFLWVENMPEFLNDENPRKNSLEISTRNSPLLSYTSFSMNVVPFSRSNSTSPKSHKSSLVKDSDSEHSTNEINVVDEAEKCPACSIS